jgi:hypothetical protein
MAYTLCWRFPMNCVRIGLGGEVSASHPVRHSHIFTSTVLLAHSRAQIVRLSADGKLC